MAFDWKSLIPIIETAANITEIAVPGGAAFLPLTQSAETALNPILLKIGSGQATNASDITSEVMSFYGTAIAALNLAKQKGGDAATIAKIDEYLAAANDGAAGYLAAGSGFSTTEFTPVTPIVVPPPVA